MYFRHLLERIFLNAFCIITNPYSNWKITVICRFESFWSRLNRNCLTYWLYLHHLFWHWWGYSRGIWSSFRAVRRILLLILPWFNDPGVFVLFLRWEALLKVCIQTDNFKLMLGILIIFDVNIDEFPTLVHTINFNYSPLK